MEIENAILKNIMEHDKNFRPQYEKCEGGENISLPNIEAQPSVIMDEEVIGIITLEDVMEALLQVDLAS